MRRLLTAAAVLLVSGLVQPAVAQDTTPGEQLGGYDANSTGLAVSVQPVFPALLPTGDAPFEATVGLSTGRVKSGGIAFGRASIVWPGNAAADPGPLFGQLFGPEIGSLFPKWPAQAEARQTDGEVSAGAPPGMVMKAIGQPDRGFGDVRTADLLAPGLVHVEHIASTSDSTVTDARVFSSARVTLQGVTLAGGYVTIEELRSFSRTTGNGSSSTQAGDVDVVGMKIGGIDVSVTDEGFQVEGAPPDAGQAPGAGGEPFPGQSPEEQVQEVLANINARITLFQGEGRSEGGQAQHFELGLVFSVDNPVGGQGPIPPGRFDVILGSTSSSTLSSSPFDVSGFGSGGAPPVETTETGSVSIGAGPAPGGSTVSEVGEGLSEPGEVTEDLQAAPDTFVPRGTDYDFDGLPTGLVVGLLLGALVASVYVRNLFNSMISSRSGVSSPEGGG